MIDPKLMALVTAVSFGLVPVTVKLAFGRGGSTGVGVIIGLAVAVPANLAVALVVDPHFERLTGLAVVAFVLGGLAGSAVGRRWIFNAIAMLGPARASIIWTSSPVFTAVAAAILYHEDVTPIRWLGILAIVAGATLVTWTPGAGARGWISRGIVYALGASLAFGSRPLFLKAGLDVADAPLAAALIGAVAALAYAVAAEDLSRLRSIRIDRAFQIFLVVGLLQTIAQLALTYAISAGDVSQVYSITASSPLFTLGFTALLLRGVEQLNLRILVGAVMTVAGVILL